MFALLAALVFFLAAVHVGLGSLDMLMLGLTLLALHFAFGVGVPYVSRRPPQ